MRINYPRRRRTPAPELIINDALIKLFAINLVYGDHYDDDDDDGGGGGPANTCGSRTELPKEHTAQKCS